MIVGVGIDLIEIETIAANLYSETYLHKIFTEAEIQECQTMVNVAEHFAGKFAAKEACMKAVGRGIRQGMWFTQIEVLHTASGAPFLQLHGEMAAAAQAIHATKIHVSITHTRTTAAAVVILETLAEGV